MFGSRSKKRSFAVLKKLIVIAVLLTYAVTSTGFNLQYFFCGDRLQAISLKEEAKKKCCKSESKDCCSKTTVSIKLQADQQATAKADYQFTKLFVSLPPVAYAPMEMVLQSGITEAFLTRPPPSPPAPIHILHRVFRI